MATIQSDASVEMVELTDEQIDQVKGGNGAIDSYHDPVLGGTRYVYHMDSNAYDLNYVGAINCGTWEYFVAD